MKRFPSIRISTLFLLSLGFILSGCGRLQVSEVLDKEGNSTIEVIANFKEAITEIKAIKNDPSFKDSDHWKDIEDFCKNPAATIEGLKRLRCRQLEEGRARMNYERKNISAFSIPKNGVREYDIRSVLSALRMSEKDTMDSQDAFIRQGNQQKLELIYGITTPGPIIEHSVGRKQYSNILSVDLMALAPGEAATVRYADSSAVAEHTNNSKPSTPAQPTTSKTSKKLPSTGGPWAMIAALVGIIVLGSSVMAFRKL